MGEIVETTGENLELISLESDTEIALLQAQQVIDALDKEYIGDPHAQAVNRLFLTAIAAHECVNCHLQNERLDHTVLDAPAWAVSLHTLEALCQVAEEALDMSIEEQSMIESPEALVYNHYLRASLLSGPDLHRLLSEAVEAKKQLFLDETPSRRDIPLRTDQFLYEAVLPFWVRFCTSNESLSHMVMNQEINPQVFTAFYKTQSWEEREILRDSPLLARKPPLRITQLLRTWMSWQVAEIEGHGPATPVTLDVRAEDILSDEDVSVPSIS